MGPQFPTCASSLSHSPGAGNQPLSAHILGQPLLSLCPPHSRALSWALCLPSAPTPTQAARNTTGSPGAGSAGRTGERPRTDTAQVGADAPPGADAALAHALSDSQFQVQERHSLHDEHDEVGHQETPCGHPEPTVRLSPMGCTLRPPSLSANVLPSILPFSLPSSHLPIHASIFPLTLRPSAFTLLHLPTYTPFCHSSHPSILHSSIHPPHP